MTPLLQLYLGAMRDTEPPKIFQIWSLMAGSAACLGRNIWFAHGLTKIVPNIYVMLIGDPGSRKSTSIKTIKKLIAESGYESFSPDKSSKEKFLQDFERGFSFDSDAVVTDQDLDNFLDEDVNTQIREVFIAADEWLEFFGEANVNFATLLGTLWDYEGVYRDRLKNSKSVTIGNPTVTLLGGCTHETFKLAFPANMLGHGFISRLLLVYGERSSKKITWPEPLKEETRKELVEYFRRLRHSLFGPVTLSKEAFALADEIYKSWEDLEDIRFQHYSTRRFTQFLKIVLILSAHKFEMEVSGETVIQANTLLTYTEQYMPKALGEFGASKTSPVAQKIMAILDNATAPMSVTDLWKQCSRDLEKVSDLAQILQNLAHAEKIQNIAGKGFLPKRAVRTINTKLVDFSQLEPLLKE